MMMADKRRPRGLSSDAGMTVVEIMIAAAIFFIVLTAILGLVGVTTNMGLQAKEITVMSNAISSYSERIQAMDFAAVVTDGSETQLSVETTTVGDYTVTITPTVRPYLLDGTEVASLKYVDFTVTVVSLRGETITQTTTITVRDRSELMSQGVSDPLTDPDIEWGDLMVPEGAVVWDHNWGGGELLIDVDATAKDGRTVEAVNVLVASRVMKDTLVPANEAMWLPHTETFSTDASFTWNTHQTYLDEYELPVEWIEDGMWTLTAWVTDSESVRASVTRHVLVDNERPPTPAKPTPDVKSAYLTTLGWPEVYDGLLPADHYVVQNWRYSLPYASWIRLEDAVSQMPNADFTSSPFTLYWAHVGAGSPRFEPSPDYYSADWSDEVWWVSRPLITGSYEVTKPDNWLTKVTLECTQPTFPGMTPIYRWERLEPGGKVTVLSSTLRTATDTVTAHKFSTAPTCSYRCTVQYRPWFEPIGTSFSTVSNTVGPTGAVSETFSEGTW